MAQSTQIVPEWSFPNVQTVINNYTGINDTPAPAAVDNNVKLIFPVVSSKGEDGTWIRFSSRKAAAEVLGESNFKVYGQPLMEALNVLDTGVADVWIMRVMPENATYSNAIVSCYYKADEASVAASERKFRIKLTRKSFENIKTAKELISKLKVFDGVVSDGNVYKDGEGYTQAPILAVRYAGHGTCGDNFSLRISTIPSYEKEYGIKLYDFQAINSDNGLTNAGEIIGSLVTSAKYGSETATLINDLIEDATAGTVPVNVFSDEDTIETVYDAYISFATTLHTDLEAEYEEKAAEYSIPADMMSGKIPVSEEYVEKYNILMNISNMIDATDVNELPDLDEFDPIFGNKVGSTDTLPGIYFVEELTDSVDISADDYNAADYTSGKVVNFTSDKGLILENGGNGYFDSPRKETLEGGGEKQWTLEDEINECYKNAWSGSYDKKILSPRRLKIDAFFDANYSFDVKQTMYELALTRNSNRVYLDSGIIDSFNQSTLYTLKHKYSIFTDRLASVDTQNFWVKEPSTNKKCNVTISYFLARNFAEHMYRYSSVIPMVNDKCQLSGHVKDSLQPIVEEYDKNVMETLNNNRFNYFICVDENVYQRGVQNTREVDDSDLIEESNILVLYRLKRLIELDLIGRTYSFTDELLRDAFVNEEKSKYSTWVGTMLQSFDISFSANEYEYQHSIVHCYLSITFRGLTKRFIVEIDINPRDYSSLLASTNED